MFTSASAFVFVFSSCLPERFEEGTNALVLPRAVFLPSFHRLVMPLFKLSYDEHQVWKERTKPAFLFECVSAAVNAAGVRVKCETTVLRFSLNSDRPRCILQDRVPRVSWKDDRHSIVNSQWSMHQGLFLFGSANLAVVQVSFR